MKRLNYHILLSLVTLSLVACSQTKVSFHVTRSSQLPVENIKYVAIGEFIDELSQKIPLPEGVSSKGAIGRGIRSFKSNHEIADFVRAFVISEISQGGEYRVMNSSGGEGSYSGAIPDATQVGVINARVKYYEYTKEGNDKRFFVLLITNDGEIRKLDLLKQMTVVGAKILVVSSAERSGKGFKIAIPYVERVAAIEVEFDFVRKSNGQKIVPTQTFRAYYTKKWGGEENASVLANEVKKAILDESGFEEKTLAEIVDTASKVALLMRDEEEYIARGYYLKQNSEVPFLPLDLRQLLGKKVARSFVKKVSRYHEETLLEVASGDAVAITLIRGNAYDKAIGHLESLPKPLSVADTFNLALAYESMGEYAQALRYYEDGYSKSKDERFKKGIDRVKRQ